MTIALLTMLLAGPVEAGATVSVRDLDPETVPTEMHYDRSTRRLVVDGTPVRGSLRKQLDYAAQVLQTTEGDGSSGLRVESRKRSLKRERAGMVISLSATPIALVGLVFLPVAVPAVVAVSATGVAVAMPARKRFDHDALADQITLYHTLKVDHSSLK